MELICNFVWLAVVLALWATWLTRRRRSPGTALLPSIAVQIVALLALTAIVLPVISITDDLQASNNPAEVDRSGGRRDHMHFLRSPQPVPGAVALVVPSQSPSPLRRTVVLPIDTSTQLLGSAPTLIRWSRPPPAA